jgi:uroporphyrinogen III methyltransferase/synthase
MTGRVYLVGAGPGDPGLLTQRARQLLDTCDVVAYDELVSDAILASVPPETVLVPVGHRGRGSSKAEYRIHPDVISHARAGDRVVRLKCGDPFIFGRGGEEAEELLRAGVPFEVVPGVSAALGAAAYAAIPLTHRDLASDVTFATGHDLLTAQPGRCDWAQLSRGRGTLVLFMGARRLAANLDRLLSHGCDPATPAAYVAAATTAAQQTIVGTVGDLAARTCDVNPDVQALIIVGEVVRLRERLAWVETRPMFGRRILVARARPDDPPLAPLLRELGAEVLEAPRLDVAPLDDPSALDEALAESWDGVVFACAEGVDAFLRHLGQSDRDFRDLLQTPIFAMSAAARDRLRERGLVATRQRPTGAGRFVLITSDDGRPDLLDELHRRGARVVAVAAYELRRSWPRVSRQPFDLVVVPNEAAARHLYGSAFGRSLAGVPSVAMGDPLPVRA